MAAKKAFLRYEGDARVEVHGHRLGYDENDDVIEIEISQDDATEFSRQDNQDFGFRVRFEGDALKQRKRAIAKAKEADRPLSEQPLAKEAKEVLRAAKKEG